jgi:hypothetical protein
MAQRGRNMMVLDQNYVVDATELPTSTFATRPLSRPGVPKVCAAAPWGAVKSKQGCREAPLFSILRNLNLLHHSLNIVTGDQFPVTRSLS